MGAGADGGTVEVGLGLGLGDVVVGVGDVGVGVGGVVVGGGDVGGVVVGGGVVGGVPEQDTQNTFCLAAPFSPANVQKSL